MSDYKKLNQSIETIGKSLEVIKEDNLSLSSMMEQFSSAIESYKQFQKCIFDECLDVKEVKVNDTGTLTEIDFDWKEI